MNREERSADALRAWLAAPGQTPSEAIDSDVLEAVILLRPDLAPPPRVTVDEILAGLPTPAPVLPPAEVIAMPRRAMRWVGGMGGVGVLLAAAATVLVVARPLLGTAPSTVPEAVQAETPSAASQKQDPEAKPVEVADVPVTTVSDGVAARLAPAKEGPGAEEQKGNGADVVGGSVGAAGVPMADVASYDVDAAPAEPEAERAKLESLGYLSEMDNTAASGGEASGDEKPDDETPAPAPPARSAPKAAPPPPAAPGGGRADKPSSKTKDAGLDDLRAAAVPADEVAEVEVARKGAAEAAVAQTAEPESRVASDLAAGRALLAAGDAAGAIALADKALRAERDNTPLRSELLVLKGDALRALGEESAAIGAWEEAARLNAQRE